ncbi:MAG: GerMN domain-containing protein [Firmicutes bacterium]|nr:GerMN domain-containing protein [Bacillota bacterium]
MKRSYITILTHKRLKLPVIFLSAVIFTALLPYCAIKPEVSQETARVYFLNSSTNTIEYEDRAITGEADTEIAGSVLDAFMEGPKNKNLTKTYPDNMQLRDSPTIRAMSDNAATKTFEVDFSKEYRDMTPLQELFFRASFVWTMTGLPFIGNVQIYVEGVKLTGSTGEPIGLLTKNDLVLNPSLPWAKAEVKTLVLYFTNADGDVLVPENRNVEVNPDTDTASYVVKELIAGPRDDGSYPVLPPDIKLQDVKTEDGVCYVSLSADFLTKVPDGACLPKTTVLAIADSLTELAGVDKVKFLVDSESIDMYRGAADLSKAVERDASPIRGGAQ